MRQNLALVLSALTLLSSVAAIGQEKCISFSSSSGSFAIVDKKKAAPVYISEDEWPGVQIAASDFVADIQRVTGSKPTFQNITAADIVSLKPSQKALPIIVGTLGKSSLISQIVNSASLDVSGIQGKWEAFQSRVVKNPLPGIDSAYVIIGSDKRGTIYALYDHSEQFGVSPWFWWADVPTKEQSSIFVNPAGCSHGSPTVKYRGIFLNDEQPALQSWAMEKYTNGTGSPHLNSPFNHFFYVKVFELILRLKGNYLWPAMWGSAFAMDDPLNQFLADRYGVVMGTSHQEPMLRSTPNEFSVLGLGKWDYTTNTDVINNYWLDGAKRARNFESIYTMGMRGFGDLPLSEETNIKLLEGVIANQTNILKTAYGSDVDIAQIPQVWCLYKEVEGYYTNGMRVPDYITLLWADDNWGNVRRFPLPEERSRSGGAGVYYHFDYVGDPRSYKWATSTQLEKVYEQLSIAVERKADRLWIVNVGDLKPYEREIEFFLNLGWNSTRWNPQNINSSFVLPWAQREFGVDAKTSQTITDIVGKLTKWNTRRKLELLNSTTYSLFNYREGETVLANWIDLEASSTKIYNSLPSSVKPAYYQLVHYPLIVSANIGKLYIYAGQNQLRASQARLSANSLADSVETLFEKDYDYEVAYNSLLNGKWNHFADQTRIGFYYWQQPMTNAMPSITRVQKRKQALPGVMRIAVEGIQGAWPGDNPYQCDQGYNCPPPTITLDNYSPLKDRYVDVGAGGPKSYTFTVSAAAPWVSLSTTRGSISPSSPEARILAGVKDWSSVPAGTTTTTINFVAKASGERDQTVGVVFTVTKNAVSGGFKGFVEGAGVVSIEPAHATRKTEVEGTSWTEIINYGRTLSAVTPWPRSDAYFAPGSGPALEYDFYSFNTIGGKGNLTVTLYLSVSLNAGSADHPLAYGIQLDGGAVSKVVPVGTSAPGGLPAGWGGNDGWVANNVILSTTTFQSVQPGKHTLKITAVEPALVIQKIVINAGGLKPSYLGPPESVIA